MSLNKGVLAALCVAGLASAQNHPKQLTARELFYAAESAPAARTSQARPASRSAKAPAKSVEIARADPAPARTSSPAKAPVQTASMPVSGEPPLGIRYTILKINSDNSTSEAPSDSVFHSGDRIRFTVETNAPGYLYIVNQGSSGVWKPMFPSPEVEDGNNHIEGWRPYTMPPNSRLAFDSTAGTENLFIVFSRKPEADLEQLIYSLRGKRAAAPPAPVPEMPTRIDKTLIMAANISDAQVGRLRNAYARDLIVEKVDAATPGDRKETAVYVVNPTGSADSRVVADLHLVHQ
jgi:hypothetical protein